ncbi:MAG: hypothetical protein AUF79_16120 [Crenarchaeota archaeon 13_1_20CM_2_51_8]|nr:MAG: hypothetical protein AUF79_16120 [Crenarchaeota archaeon 13_1_20CM_2_51_8]
MTKIGEQVAELKIYLSDSLNEKFRQIAMSVHGYGRGSLSKAAEEALTKWCSEHESRPIHRETVDQSETTHQRTKAEVESHINPDERESSNQEVRGVGENDSKNATGPTA